MHFQSNNRKIDIKDPIVHKIAKPAHAMDIKDELDKVPEAKGIKMIISGARFAA